MRPGRVSPTKLCFAVMGEGRGRNQVGLGEAVAVGEDDGGNAVAGAELGEQV